MEKTVLRNKSIGTKVSEEEYAQLEKLAEARELTFPSRANITIANTPVFRKTALVSSRAHRRASSSLSNRSVSPG